ncbi:hypothetical protein OF83DRAFT_561103 [Amylostereum chailletii]|nr:hypothetical protein OF83DRAFT_561103 [Amylostereum chailletii]
MFIYAGMGGGRRAAAARIQSISGAQAMLRGQTLWIPRRLRHSGLSTLDPARLCSSDYLDLSGLIKKILPPSTNPRPKPAINYLSCYPPRMETLQRMNAPFPPHTHGFLYYHPPSGPPPFDEGQLRFRITHDSDPAAFADGTDLLFPDGQPWNISAGRLVISKQWNPILRILLEDGLVAEAQLNEWKTYYDEKGRRRDLLKTLETPFLIRFSHAYLSLRVYTSADSDRTAAYILNHPLTAFNIREHTKGHISLCDGIGICRFEDVGIRTQSSGRPKLAMRLVKILEPLQPSEEAIRRGIAVTLPEEGELMLHPKTGQLWTKWVIGSLQDIWDREATKPKKDSAQTSPAD